MINFETYCLSLKSNTDRREWMLSIKDKIGLNFKFWDALTPNDITIDLKEKYFKNVNFYEWTIIPEAAMATFLSHMNILNYSVINNKNVLLIEDDLDYVNPFNWENLEYNFDVFKFGTQGIDCYAYMVTPNGAKQLLNHFNSIVIREAYDLELHKIKHLKFRYLRKPVFIQIQNKFISNIAPDGYKKIKNVIRS